jgi:Fe(3+) dicitrate transport protein
MKKTIYILVLMMAAISLKASNVKGVLVSETGEPFANQMLYLTNGSQTTSNKDGAFVFQHVMKGSYELKTEKGGQLITLNYFKVENETNDVELGKVVLRNNFQLPEVEIIDQNINNGVERMPDVKDNVIYSGKKTEVIRLSTATANLAQNNSRQIFAKVPGIQVWESDGSGVQMGVAARGLSPNRMWEFNTRQNGYDISADPFGYPEAYYTPSVESLDRIEVIRGAASLQYGPQFGGVINYVKKRSVSGKKIGVESTQSFGSYGMFSTFNAIGGNHKKFSYYTNINYRRSDGWRQNNGYNTWNGYVNLGYQLTKKININAEYTRMDQLVQQPGGLTDSMFNINAKQSLRSRNWFKLVWNIAALNFDYQINSSNKLNIKAFGLMGERSSIGFMSGINVADAKDVNGIYGNRLVDQDKYNNYGVEARHLYTYRVGKQKQSLAVGARYYVGNTDRIQNKFGNRGTDYSLATEQNLLARDLNFKTHNAALFAEHLFNINKRLSITPGVRYEYLKNTASGILDLKNVDRESSRSFALLGVGAQYKVTSNTNIYANYTQGYRPVLFSDISVVTTDSINPDLKDASGYNLDLGYRGNFGRLVSFDVSAYIMYYGNRIGSYNINGKNYRTNIGASESRGIESYIEVSPTNMFKTFKGGHISLFATMAFTQAEYVSWNDPDINKNQKGKRVENAPKYIHRFGLTYRYKSFTTSLQYSLVGYAFADALNTTKPNATATTGLIPSYEVADWSFQLTIKKLYNINCGINNIFDTKYFTRRAGGYPGPGLLPAEGRIWYVGVGVKI